MKRILITGANSYIGTSFEKYMAQWPDEYQVDTIDMVDGSWRGKSFAGYDSVFHVAGIAHINTKKLDKTAQEQYWAVNAELPVEIAKKAKLEGVKQFIFLSSMSVFGEHGSIKKPVVIRRDTLPNPQNIYGKSKLDAERGIQPLGSEEFAICILRPPMIYGQGCKGNYQSLAMLAIKTPVFPDFDNQRSMLHIDNLVVFLRDLIDSCASGTLHPENKEYVNTSFMVKLIAEYHGRKVWFTKLLNPVIRFAPFSMVSKVFGSLVLEKGFSIKCDSVSFEESIQLSEGARINEKA